MPTYRKMNRLTTMTVSNTTRTVGYANNGNISSMPGVGALYYGSTDHPYQVSLVVPSATDAVPAADQTVSYTGYHRPLSISQGGQTASFIYDENDNRSRMTVVRNDTTVLTRHYLGGCYEVDEKVAQTDQRLYLGGNQYDAPMVYVKEGTGGWTLYNIGRDYLGSVTHVATAAGVLVAEYSYDPWGRQRDPATLSIYDPGDEPDLFLGRGFTGHEHLDWCGLINMNARLYDPLYGRFLSPDPYVQAPDFSQNFNRYSYALNNPLKYTDEDGEFIGTILTSILRIPLAIVKGIVAPFFVGFEDSSKASQMFEQAWTEYGKRVSNAYKIDIGLFQTDSDLSIGEQVFTLLSRLVWEAPQTVFGNGLAHFRNNFWITNIEYYHGATLVNRDDNSMERWGITSGSYINSLNLVADPIASSVFAHEYGHTKQSQIVGPLYLPCVGFPSLVGSLLDYELHLSNDHDREWYEVWANQLSYNYYEKHGYTTVTSAWSSKNPRTQNLDWYFFPTVVYYAGLVLAAGLLLF